MLTRPDLQTLHAGLIETACEAGRLALRDYRPGARTVANTNWKDGGSPVTSADLAVDRYLAEALPRLQAFPVHSEERPESWTGDTDAAFVIDPIDGTRDFADGGDAWCIVAGVILKGIPVAGVVHLPARNVTYSAFRGGGAFRNRTPLTHTGAPSSPLCVTGPRPVAEVLARRSGLAFTHAMPVPALAHRVLVPIGGEVDLALARAGGHDWDIVASDCILREAGCALLTLGGDVPAYGLKGTKQPALVAGATALIEKLALGAGGNVSYLTSPT
jgi:myo-inositol-1(or 4)-monophosphatase